jgi:hypothetical protein
VLTYAATIPLSTRSLVYLSGLLAAHRHEIGSRWRRLTAGEQALLVLAHLRNGDTYARLAAGFRVGIATVYRYVREAVDLLAAAAPDLGGAMRTARAKAFVILDGTLISTDRIGGSKDRAYYSGKHKRHGVNVQVLADPHGELLWASPALPGSVHDLKAARTHGLIDALTRSAVATIADKGYRGARGAVGVPFYGRHLPTRMREVNSAHAKVRAIGERAVSTLKAWGLLTKLRCCPQRATALVAAILTLHLQATS